MSTTRISDVIVPEEFTDYLIQNTMQQTALFQSGVVVLNGMISDQLSLGSHSFNVPFWNDLSDDEADIVTDDPDTRSTPKKLGSAKHLIRKSYLHQSWSAMNLASELSGSDAMKRIQTRVTNYWNRQLQSRLIASLKGVLADNQANHNGDMIYDARGSALDAKNVIRAAATLGDAMGGIKSIAMHSTQYAHALENDLIEFIRDSDGSLVMTTYRGLAVVVDDGLTADEKGVYTNILFGGGAVGYATAEPRVADGTEIENLPSAGNGGGQQVLHSRINTAIHPLGFSWKESSVSSESPSLAELAKAANWSRIVERKAVPLAFLLVGGEKTSS